MRSPGDIYESEQELGLAIERAIEHRDDFPQYAYGILQAAALAARLKVRDLSAIELGVAGGNGLVCLESLARKHSPLLGVGLHTYGFDLGSGMPEPVDYRDMPYIWQPGFFRMDEGALRDRLDEAHLLIGDIRVTIPQFLAGKPPPVGFISFDLDYYSSTRAAMDALLLADANRFLPRVICYFDDTVGPHYEMHSRFTGELLAIEEFNEGHERRKLAPINGLRYKIAPHDGSWVAGIYVLHLFDHPRYNDYIYPATDRQFPLTDLSA